MVIFWKTIYLILFRKCGLGINFYIFRSKKWCFCLYFGLIKSKFENLSATLLLLTIPEKRPINTRLKAFLPNFEPVWVFFSVLTMYLKFSKNSIFPGLWSPIGRFLPIGQNLSGPQGPGVAFELSIKNWAYPYFLTLNTFCMWNKGFGITPRPSGASSFSIRKWLKSGIFGHFEASAPPICLQTS